MYINFKYRLFTSTFTDLVSGGSKDFAYDQNIPLSYTIELRDTGRYGFILPESEV